MLRADKKAEFVRVPWSIPGLFTGRIALQSANTIFDARWRGGWYAAASEEQLTEPVQLCDHEERSYWWFHDAIYWEDDWLEAIDVKALVLQRERSARRKLQTAHSLMRAEEAGRATRSPVPTEIRRAVYERDRGACIECGSGFDLQYDHVLPLSRGGATTVENLQLLCGDCNRRKGASI